MTASVSPSVLLRSDLSTGCLCEPGSFMRATCACTLLLCAEARLCEPGRRRRRFRIKDRAASQRRGRGGRRPPLRRVASRMSRPRRRVGTWRTGAARCARGTDARRGWTPPRRGRLDVGTVIHAPITAKHSPITTKHALITTKHALIATKHALITTKHAHLALSLGAQLLPRLARALERVGT